LQEISAGFAIALHMHQPIIPAGPQGQLISHLQYMFEHPYEGENRYAGSCAYCYSRLSDFIPELIAQGCQPRIMLAYSGALLWGLQQMGRQDILKKLQRLTDAPYLRHVEWLGGFWGNCLASATPLADLKLHIQAWQHQFASLFGLEPLKRVRGFSLGGQPLPNHPDTLYTLVHTLRACGYHWLLTTEQSLETLDGQPIAQPLAPHQLIARNQAGDTAQITVLIQPHALDPAREGLMQAYHQAQQHQPLPLASQAIPPLVIQEIAGDTGDSMMHEFPGAFKRTWHALRGSRTAGLNGTEYLELLEQAGLKATDWSPCQARGQHQLWQQCGDTAPSQLATAIANREQRLLNFSMASPALTHDPQWVDTHQTQLSPSEQLSAQFHKALADVPVALQPHLAFNPTYRNALFHLLLLQSHNFAPPPDDHLQDNQWRHYAQEICRRGLTLLKLGF
jgi:hypothetical protein